MHFAIIGAGVGGLTLGHALHEHGISFDIFDSREEVPPPSKGTTVICTPNTLRVLDYTGAYEKLLPLGYQSDRFNVLNADLDLLSQVKTGDQELYGYSSLRVYRHAIVDKLRVSLIEKGAGQSLHWRARFQRIVSDDADGVTFELSDGSQHKASLLIGADGIYSRVRSHITDIVASYTGVLAPIAVLDGPPPAPKSGKPLMQPCVVNCDQGGFVISPQGTGEETVCFRHIDGFPDLGRKGWEELAEDKARILEILRKDEEKWPEYVRQVMEVLPKENMTHWPFHQMPDLPKWQSPTGNVVIIGDAAHAVPPSSAQGAAQAVEDGFSLGMVLAAVQERSLDRTKTLEAWQLKRMERIHIIQTIAKGGVTRKLPKNEQERLDAGKGFDTEPLYAQLFRYNLKADYNAWVEEQT